MRIATCIGLVPLVFAAGTLGRAQNSFPTSGGITVTGGESHVSEGTYSDPNPGVARDLKLGNNGLALNGGLIVNSGNVGIGTAGPEQLLQVGATYSQNPAILIGGNDNNNGSTGAYALLFGAWRDIEANMTSGIVATPVWTCCGGYPSGGYAGIRTNNLSFYTFYDPANPSNNAPQLYISGSSGAVGIGTTNPQYPLSVNGTIQAKEVLVNTGWSDYVFDSSYRVKPLTEVAAFIKANHHLPDIPSEAEVKEKGVSLGDMQSKLLAKIEELTLQMIKLDEKNSALEKKLAQFEGRQSDKTGADR